MPEDFNQRIVEEFRANAGRVGGPFDGARLLLLTTAGSRSGNPHTVPLGYLHDGDGRMLVIASAAGAPAHPDWYRNLLADPHATVETGVFTAEVHATVLDGEERDSAFARAVEADPGWADYQAKTDRVIPVVTLEPTSGAPNATSWGESLALIHGAFRRELATVRKEIAESGSTLGAQLRINCLTVCQGLGHHHASEDSGMFPGVEAARPDLAEPLARLRLEHEEVARLVDELQQLVSSSDVDPTRLAADVDRLARHVEAHLDYEEEQLVPVLDALTP